MSNKHAKKKVEFGDIIGNQNAPVMRVSLETGRIDTCNASAESYYGYPDLEGKDFCDLVHSRSPQEVETIYQNIRTRESSSSQCSGTHIKKDGEIRSIKALIERGPNRKFFYITVFDVGKMQGTENNVKSKTKIKAADHGFTDQEKTIVKERKAEFLRKAEAAALRAIKEEWKKEKHTGEIDAQALIHACLSLSTAMPRALDVARKIVRVENADVDIDESLVLTETAWVQRN